jgi:hypothetical protein
METRPLRFANSRLHVINPRKAYSKEFCNSL